MIKFVLPLLLWVFLLRDFIFGAIPFNMDTNTIYGVAKFYFNNVLNGVIPLWDPFVSLGHPFYALSICNLFNPVTQLIIIFKLLGISYNVAFALYMVIYFWVGCFGFYMLVKQILKDNHMAYLGYLAFMFSSLGVSLFTQLTFIEIVVPTVWFFYFLLAFNETQNKGNFLGLAYSLMIVVSSYLPFYFLTVAMAFFIVVVFLFPKETFQFCLKSYHFKKKHWLLALLCVGGIAAAMGPLLAYKMLDASGDAVSPGRHCQYTSAQECYDRTINHQGGMLYEEIARSGGLGERFDIGYLFTHLDKITYGSDSLFFLPFWMFILFGLSIFLKCDRINIVLLGMMTLIGLIALGSAGPLHRILYEHIFFFKYFRNLFFLGAFLLPIFIIFVLKQLKSLLELNPQKMSHKKLIGVGIVLAHGAMAFYLKSLGGIMTVMWVTLGLSAVILTAYYLLHDRLSSGYWIGIFAVLMLVQPIYVINAYAKNALEFECSIPNQHVVPQFGWVRPDLPATSACRIYQFVPYEDFWYAMSMQDAPAIVGYPQAAAKWVFMLSKQMGDAALAQYAKYKVYLFDDLKSSGQVITGENPLIKVSHFDVNRVEFDVNLPKEKLFVYNDAYTQHWRVAIDGKERQLLKSSGAFKGVWVPEGRHVVAFSYHPPGGQWVYLLTVIILFTFFIYTVIMLKLKR